MRLDALRRLGHTVVGVDTTSVARGVRSLWARGARKAGWAVDTAGANRALLEVAQRQNSDVVWIDKGLTIRPQTLTRLRELVPQAAAGTLQPGRYEGGAQSVKKSTWQGCRCTIYISLTSRITWLNSKEMGARRVLFVDNAFCPSIHRPVTVSDEDRTRVGGPIGFIGAFEKERAEAIWFLATHNLSVRVWGEGWGQGWKEWAASHHNAFLRVEDRALFGDDYAKAICSFSINLCFLRKLNRDLQTTRVH